MARRTEPRHTGILLVDKPPGPTSHDIVGWIRWALRERTVGHCGTLDPLASGLLVICVGEATRLVDHLTGVDKVYRARFVLGRSTTTADAAGEVLDRLDLPDDPSQGVRGRAAVEGLLGDLELPPPAYSAVRIAGKRAHELARAGEQLDLPTRPMSVRALEVLECGYERDAEGRGSWWIDVEVRVSKGTYVRSLAEEIGRRVGCPAHLGRLRRSACGDFQVDEQQVVRGLSPIQLPDLEGRPPRWRVEFPFPELAGDREATGDRLRACMRAPWSRLPFPCFQLQGTAHSADLVRLIQGQRLLLNARTKALFGVPPGLWGRCGLVDQGAARMLLVDIEREGGGARGLHPRIAPARVIRLLGHVSPTTKVQDEALLAPAAPEPEPEISEHPSEDG